MAEVIINIDAEGNVSLESRGITGASCKAVTEAIEKALGNSVSDQTTAEYFQPEQAHVRAGGNRR